MTVEMRRLSIPDIDPTWGWGIFLSRVTYRPNVRLEVGAGPALHVHMDVLDSYTRCPIQVTHRLPLPTYTMTDADRARCLRDLLFQVEMHEAREWLRIDGVILFDPHRSGPVSI